LNGFLFQSEYYHYWKQHFNRSKSTIRKYILALKRFEAFLQREGFEGELDFEQFHGSREYPDRYLPIKRKVIEDFVHYLINGERVTANVLSATVTALKGFFCFLYDLDLIQHNPTQDFPTPKYEKTIQNTALSLEGQKTDPNPVAIPKNLAEELERYINHPNYLKWKRQGSEYLFHDNNGRRLSYMGLVTILSELSQEAKLSRIVRPHDLRRTTGYLMQLGGADMIEVKNQLRHKDLGTTLRYVPPLLDMAKILEDD
jgi:integrase/recombinase XerD